MDLKQQQRQREGEGPGGDGVGGNMRGKGNRVKGSKLVYGAGVEARPLGAMHGVEHVAGSLRFLSQAPPMGGGGEGAP